MNWYPDTCDCVVEFRAGVQPRFALNENNEDITCGRHTGDSVDNVIIENRTKEVIRGIVLEELQMEYDPEWVRDDVAGLHWVVIPEDADPLLRANLEVRLVTEGYAGRAAKLSERT